MHASLILSAKKDDWGKTLISNHPIIDSAIVRGMHPAPKRGGEDEAIGRSRQPQDEDQHCRRRPR
jgi:hypothetical protein